MGDTVKVVLKLAARPDKLAEVTALLQHLAAQSRKEAGCLGYQVLQNGSDPGDFVLVEEWSGNAALDAHMTTAHVQDAFAQAPALLAKAPERGVYKSLR
jgi:quinol monooxygenase YgiN